MSEGDSVNKGESRLLFETTSTTRQSSRPILTVTSCVLQQEGLLTGCWWSRLGSKCPVPSTRTPLASDSGYIHPHRCINYRERCILTDLGIFAVDHSLKEVHRGIKGMLRQILLIQVLHLTFAMLGRSLTHKERSALFRQHTPHSLGV